MNFSKELDEYNNIVVTLSDALKIYFMNNLDLYFEFLNVVDKEQVFKITKDNYEIYSLFLNLYQSIINDNKIKNQNNLNKLVINKKIVWYSDEEEKKLANVLVIKKEEDIILTFIKNKEKNNSNAIRIRNSGSRYYPFNINFMKLYRKLIKVEENIHQYHLEEFVYKKKR